MRRFFSCPKFCFVSSLPGFLSRGVDWRDADGDELAVRRLKGFRSAVGLLVVLLVGSIIRTAPLYCVGIFVLILRIWRSARCPWVELHRLHPVQPASLPHMQTHDFKVLHHGEVHRGIVGVCLWEAWLSMPVFMLSAATSDNFDSCSTSVSSHCMTATWSSFTILVRFGDMSLAIDAACFHH